MAASPNCADASNGPIWLLQKTLPSGMSSAAASTASTGPESYSLVEQGGRLHGNEQTTLHCPATQQGPAVAPQKQPNLGTAPVAFGVLDTTVMYSAAADRLIASSAHMQPEAQ